MRFRVIIISAFTVLACISQALAVDWQFKGLSGRQVISLAADPDNGQYICAGTDSGLYVSANAGDTWVWRITNELTIPDLAYGPLTNDTLFCLVGGSAGQSGLHFSANSGQDWAMISNFINPRRLAFDPVNPGFMYICFPDGILKSQNYGYNVASANNGLPSLDVLDVSGDGTHGLEAYAVCPSSLGHTIDFGNVWTEIAGLFDIINHNPYRITYEPNGPETLYVTTYAYFASTFDGGFTWDYTLMTALEFRSIVCDPVQPGKLFIGSAGGGGVFVTNDAGASFNAINSGLGDQHVQSLALDALGNLWAGTDDGVYVMPGPVSIDDNSPNLPESFRLDQNYPNPFNNRTIIEFFLNDHETGLIEIYDIAGRSVKKLPVCTGSGFQKLIWNGTDETGQSLSSGIYFYRLKIDDNVYCRRIMLLK